MNYEAIKELEKRCANTKIKELKKALICNNITIISLLEKRYNTKNIIMDKDGNIKVDNRWLTSQEKLDFTNWVKNNNDITT